MPYTETPFSQAIFQMFENLDTYLERNYNDLPQEAVKVYLFGGCAIHLHIGSRVSNDLDAELELIQRLKPIATLEAAIKAVGFNNEEDDYCMLDFDGNFNPTIAPIHPDYKVKIVVTIYNQIKAGFSLFSICGRYSSYQTWAI
ncbi:MAG: hypothetical protein Tsb0014_29120 [Pleurocapsa sp.]